MNMKRTLSAQLFQYLAMLSYSDRRIALFGLPCLTVILVNDKINAFLLAEGWERELIAGRISISPQWNQGMAFSLFPILTKWIISISFLLLLLLSIVSMRSKSAKMALAFSLMWGGAICHLIERCRFGAIIDYLLVNLPFVGTIVLDLGDLSMIFGAGIILWAIFCDPVSFSCFFGGKCSLRATSLSRQTKTGKERL